MKQLFYIFALLISTSLLGQIAISEVYYDTPVKERLDLTKYAHLGEFIELFNYSTQDFDISGWLLYDNESSYSFPEGTVIHSGDYIVVAKGLRQGLLGSYEYFFSMFPTATGNEGKLKYQSKILLNNYDDGISLVMNSVNGKETSRQYLMSSIKWDCKSFQFDTRNGYCDRYYYNNAIGANGLNFDQDYYVESFQKSSSDMQLKEQTISQASEYRRATPFGLGFNFELIDLSEIDEYNEFLYGDYCSVVDWQGSVNHVLNSGCDNSIATLSEPSFSFDVVSRRCFNFDEAGNQYSSLDCSPTVGLGDDEIETNVQLGNHFYIAPNPTYSSTTLSWDQEVNNLISSIIIVPINGANEIPIQFNATSQYVEVNMNSYTAGLYVVRFCLNTGEYVTKYIMKL